MSAQLPPGWSSARLREIADVQLGKMLDRKRTKGTRYQYLRNLNVRWGHIDTTDLLDMYFQDDELDRFSIRSGDVLVCEGGEPGRAAVWTGAKTDLKFQKALHRVRLLGDIDPRWLVYHLHFDADQGQLSERFTGTTINHLTREAIRECEIRLPPVQEQQRILAALDSYLSRLDDAVSGLERVQRNLNRYRASVLQAAVEGRLVPTEAELARADGRDYEPASELLKRILAERRRRWEHAELERLNASGKLPTDDRWKKKYKEPITPGNINVHNLPTGWCWSTLDQLTWHSGYGTSTKCAYAGAGERVLRIPNIQDGAVDLGDVKRARASIGINSSEALAPGDFLVIRTNGSRNLIARAGLVQKSPGENYFFASYLIRFRLVGEATGPWLLAFWHAPGTRTDLEAEAATSAGQYNVSQSALLRQPVPLPPLAEQERIAPEVDRLLSIEHDVGSSIGVGRARCDRLRQAILESAFKGNLVDQDPSDEPAAVLLERIRKNRETESGQGGTRRRRRGRARA